MIKPLQDRVLLKVLESEETTKSGIILSTDNTDKTKMAEVIEVGKDVDEIKKSDKVIIKKYSGSEIVYENQEYIIIDKEEILAVIK